MANSKDLSSKGIFEPVRQRRAFEEIVLQIEQAIVDGHLSVGDRLPPERELASIFGVSRPAVREALRVLEAFGVIVARRGTGSESGSIVSSVDGTSGLGSLLRIYASLMRIPLSDLLAVREALETEASRAASQRAGEEDFRELEAITQRMADTTAPEDFLELDTEFHMAIARVSGNAAASLLMDALRQAIAREMLRAFEAVEDFESERERLVEDHAHLVRVIRSHDADAAGRAMSEHIHSFYSRVLQERGEGAPATEAPARSKPGSGPAPRRASS